MDNIREKLVELMECITGCVVENCKDCEHTGKIEQCVEFRKSWFADYLIAHGVTVQEWIPVSERLPDEYGAYLVTTNYFGKFRGINIRSFAKDGEAVDEYDLAGKKDVWYFYDSEYGYVSTDSVTHWMPLPTPPKGE